MIYTRHIPDIYQTYDILCHMTGIYLVYIGYTSYIVICQVYICHIPTLKHIYRFQMLNARPAPDSEARAAVRPGPGVGRTDSARDLGP